MPPLLPAVAIGPTAGHRPVAWLRARLERIRLDDLAYFVLLGGLLGLAVWPLYSVRLLPLQDAYSHQAIAHILHTILAEPNHPWGDVFFLAPPVIRPNSLYFWLCHGLAGLLTVEAATRLLLAAYVVAMPLTLGRLLQTLGQSRWLVFVILPFAYNAHVALGFVAYLLATPLLFATLDLGIRFLGRGGAWRAVALVLGSALTLLAHAQVFLVLLAALGLALLLVPSSWRRRGVLALTALPAALGVFGPWFLRLFVDSAPTAAGIQFGTADAGLGAIWTPLGYFLARWPSYINNYFLSDLDEIPLVVFTLLVLALRGFSRQPAPPAADHPLAVLRVRPIEAFTFLFLALSFLPPSHIANQAVIRERHVLFAFLFLLGWLPWPREAIRHWALVVFVTTLNAAYFLGVRGEFQAFERDQQPLLHLVALLPPGATVARVPDNNLEGRMTYGALWHLHAYVVPAAGALTRLSFAEYPGTPLQYRPGRVPPALTRTDFWNDPAVRAYDFLLVRTGAGLIVPLGLAPRFVEVAHNAQWALVAVGSNEPRGP